MAYLAQCAPERIPMTLVEGAVEDEAERLEALAALAEVSLVKHDPFEDGTPAVTVHRLVQAVARARSEANGSAQDAVERLIARLVAIYPEDGYSDPQSWPLCAQLTPHLLGACACPDDASGCRLARAFGSGRQLFPRPRGLLPSRAASSRCTGKLREGARPRASRYGDEPQQPRPPASGPGRPCGGAAALRARAGDPRRRSAPSIPIRRRASTTSPACSRPRATLRGRGRSMSARWRSARRRSAPSIPIRRRASTTSPSCSRTRATLRGRGRSSSARWRSARRRSARASRYGDEPQQPRPPAPGPGRPCGGAAALRARAGDPRKGARPRASRYGGEPQQSRRPATGPGRLRRRAAALRARTGDLREGARPRASDHQSRTQRYWPACCSSPASRPKRSPSARPPSPPTTRLLGRDHAWTKDSARVTADALDALGRTEEAKALRERYGVTEPENPEPSSAST